MKSVISGICVFLSVQCGIQGEGARSGMDVNKTPPRELNWPFFDWVGRAEEFTAINHWRSYYYEHEFHFWLQRDGGERIKMVSRESTAFTDDWRFGPTFLPVEVDWSKQPQVRAIGVKLIDRHLRNFHNIQLPENACTPMILYVREQDQWVEWMVNNWFHDWHKYIDPETKEEHPGLDNVDLAQYYIGKREPYDVFGHMNAIGPDLYDDYLRRIQAGTHKGKIYHGFLVSDAKSPKGYRIALEHIWLDWAAGLNEMPGFGNPGTLKPHFVLPQLREWNFSDPPWPLTLSLDTADQRRQFAQDDAIELAAALLNHSEREVKVALPKGEAWPAFELRQGRRNVSTRPPVTTFPEAEVHRLAPGKSVTTRLLWRPLSYGYQDLKGKDVPLALSYSASFFCDARKLGVLDTEISSARIHLVIDEVKPK